MTMRLVAILLLTWSTALVSAAQLPFRPGGPPPTWESCEEMHDLYLRRFESADGFGLSRMHTPRMRDLTGTLDTGRVKHRLERLELIGLLLGPSPVVYTPFAHSAVPGPDFKSRALTAFETRALADFRAGRDMAVQEDRGVVTACVGAMRAAPTCLKCHDDAKAGDLLGAFSYTISRANWRSPQVRMGTTRYAGSPEHAVARHLHKAVSIRKTRTEIHGATTYRDVP